MIQGVHRNDLCLSSLMELALIMPIFSLEMLSAYYICWVYLIVLQKMFTMEANTMNLRDLGCLWIGIKFC